DDGDLPAISVLIIVGNLFDHFCRAESLFQQRHGFWSVSAICCRLRGDGADTGLGPRHGRAGTESAGLHTDTEFIRRWIECNDRERRKPGFLARYLTIERIAVLSHARNRKHDEQ